MHPEKFLRIGPGLCPHGTDRQTDRNVCVQVLDAVQFLHHHGIVHLNIAPDNVIMGQTDRQTDGQMATCMCPCLHGTDRQTERQTDRNVCVHVLDAVQFLHHRGIVHLNIAPDNVIMGQTDRQTDGQIATRVCLCQGLF